MQASQTEPDHCPGAAEYSDTKVSDADGWFTDASLVRRISRESVLLLGGGRAVLLQLAHPSVAEGVAGYSRFQSDPLTRLSGTIDLMYTLIFGNRREAREALQRFHAMHRRIEGQISEGTNRFPTGTRYSASDSALKLWVHATLIDSSLETYEKFVAPLTQSQRRRYYEETTLVARLLGISEAVIPPTLDDFRNYMTTMLHGDELAVTDTARELARDVLNPDVGILPGACAGVLRFATAGLLPERLRVEYGLAWSRRHQVALDGFGRSTRLVRPVAPAWLWQSPALRNDGLLNWLLRSSHQPG